MADAQASRAVAKFDDNGLSHLSSDLSTLKKWGLLQKDAILKQQCLDIGPQMEGVSMFWSPQLENGGRRFGKSRDLQKRILRK